MIVLNKVLFYRFRSKQARREFARRREQYLKEWVATRLQSIWRGRKARRHAILVRMQRRIEDQAATRMQCMFRKRQAKKRVAMRKEELHAMKCEEMARLIQVMYSNFFVYNIPLINNISLVE
jgi:hypothetical protein